MIAHTRTSDGAFQPLTEHCKSVAALCQRFAESIGLGQTARLIGLLHDMGKATRAFDSYLRAASASPNQPSSPHRHAPTGAIYAYRQWFAPKETGSSTRMTAQLISLCILGHHAGLCDCLDDFGQSPYLEAMQEERNLLHYDEAVGWSLTHVATRDELTALFFAARTEAEERALSWMKSVQHASAQRNLGAISSSSRFTGNQNSLKAGYGM